MFCDFSGKQDNGIWGKSQWSGAKASGVRARACEVRANEARARGEEKKKGKSQRFPPSSS